VTAAPAIVLRPASPGEVPAMFALIAANVAAGHLLPRTVDDVHAQVSRFVVAVRGQQIVGCAELDPISPHLAEVRSLAVAADARGQRVGTRLVGEMRRRAEAGGYRELCVMTHAADYFARFGFSVVPDSWVEEKVLRDCVHCSKFRVCGQFAMVVPLAAPVRRQHDGIRVPFTIALRVA
jgi:amino-acid N-acetyltransferase